MKNILPKVAVMLLAGSSAALAAGGSAGQGMSPLTIVFLVFCALIVVFQAIPGLVLFVSMLRGLFSAVGKKAGHLVGTKDRARH